MHAYVNSVIRSNGAPTQEKRAPHAEEMRSWIDDVLRASLQTANVNRVLPDTVVRMHMNVISLL